MGVFLSNCASTRPSCSQWRSEWQPMDSSLARLGLLEREERGRRVGNGMQPLFRLSRGRARRLCKCCSRRRNRCHSGLFSPPSLSWYAHTLIPITSPATTILRGILFRSSRTKFLTNSGKQGEGEREREPLPLSGGDRRGCELKGKRSSPPQPFFSPDPPHKFGVIGRAECKLNGTSAGVTLPPSCTRRDRMQRR